MAQFTNNTQIAGGNFINNPVVVGIRNEAVLPKGASFLQVKLLVNVYYNGVTYPYTFSMEVIGSNDVYIDISSALRSAMSGFSYEPSLLDSGRLDMEPCQYDLTVWEEYLFKGEIVATSKRKSGGVGYGLHGGLTELERYAIKAYPDNIIPAISQYTRKPLEGEIFTPGELYPISKNAAGGNYIVETYPRIVPDERITDISGRKIFVEHNPNRRTFLFVNGLGVFETASCLTRESLSYDIKTEEKTITHAPSYFTGPSIMPVKTGGRATMKMSSGYVTRAWADWWVNEFLMAGKYWMKAGEHKIYDSVSGHFTSKPMWIPCTVEPAEGNTKVYDMAKQGLCCVNFNVNLGFSGPMISSLKV